MANAQFNLKDFFQVGDINVQSDIQSIDITNLNTKAQTPKVDSVQYGLDILSDAAALVSENLSTAYSNLQSIKSIVQASSGSSVPDIAGAFSLIDTSISDESLSKILDGVNKFAAALGGTNIQAPLLKLYFDAAVSEQARNSISQGLDSYRALKYNLDAAEASLNDTYNQVHALSEAAYNASNALIELFGVLAPRAITPGAEARLAGLIASSETLRDLGARALNTESKITSTISSLHDVSNKIQDNINSYQSALTTPLAYSTWTTSADINGALSAYFTADFTNITFNKSGADSPGEFIVGKLSIHNYVTPGAGDSILNGSIDFKLSQHVTFLGETKDYTGISSTNFQYVATLNSDDPIASSDGFYISSLGVSLGIQEDTTASFLVYGSVNSPFQITRFVSNDSNGFVTIDPLFIPAGTTVNPPIASDDSYRLAANTVLSVTSAGLLLNDDALGQGSLTAALVSKPEHGALTLAADGSFIYVPEFDYVGKDFFTYIAKNGLLPSFPAKVDLTIDAPTASENNPPVSKPDPTDTGNGANVLLVHDSSNPSGAVFALYEGLLGHAPDAASGRSWVAALNAGTSLHDVTTAILSSPEAQTHINASDNSGFINQLYETVLGRRADPDSAHSWMAALDAGTVSRADVANALVFSDEHVTQLQTLFNTGVPVTDPGVASAVRLYHGLLDRAPDQTGLQNISDVLSHGGSLQQVAQNILTSAEYTGAHPQMSDGQYVEALYQSLLERAGDAASANSWVSALANGTDRTSVANAFLDSAEFQGHYANQSSEAYVDALYQHVFGHAGDASTVQSLASQLDAHSVSRIDVAHSLTASSEFQSHYQAAEEVSLWRRGR